ncbi:MAG: MetS family NSS transporter small subunit [Bacteroidetes bacterium]|nr:MetS family NSS transporter small subunit [Bacteroidota bacterium]
MEISTIITMVLVLGIVWGGLAFFLMRAIKYEKVKSKNGKK